MKFSKILRPAAVMLASALLTATSVRALTVNDLPTRRVNGKVVYYYDVQPGDNLYGIAEKLGISVNDIRQNNPSVADGVKPRMRLFFPAETESKVPAGDYVDSGAVTHVVKKGESIYGIARQYGMKMEDLMALNPSAAGGIRPGMRLRLKEQEAGEDESVPVEKEEDSIARMEKADSIVASYAPDDLDVAASEEVYADSVAADTVLVSAEDREPLQLAVILPFLLEEENMGRQTQLYTEFYKGFLLAADTLNLPGRRPVNIRVYDSSANNDTVRAIMTRPEMADVDLIIAPDNQTQLNSISAIAPQDALIVNVFAVRDTSYMTRPGMIQTNIPHDRMYERAIEGFIDSYPGYTPVFLSRKGGRQDKEEFTTALKQRLNADGRYFREVEFDGYMPDADLEDLDPNVTPLVFIPVSGNRDEFSRFIHALKTVKERAADASAVQLFGYPEWATFRGEQFDQICALETTIYSRYCPLEGSDESRRLHEDFTRAFGNEILDKQMPVLGVLGYDTGIMVIEGLRSMEARDGDITREFSGIQSGIRLREVPGGGMFNDALFLIKYMPGGSIEKTLK